MYAFARFFYLVRNVSHWLVQSTALVSSRRSLAEAAAAAAAIKARLGPAARFKTGRTGNRKAYKRGAGAAVTATTAEGGRSDGRHRGVKESAGDEVGTRYTHM